MVLIFLWHSRPPWFWAQLSTASLNGVGTRFEGAVVPKANVVLIHVETTVERSTVTNDAGNYVFQNITPGRYKLNVNAPSFSSKQISELCSG